MPGHVHLRDMGALVADAVAEAGGVGREFNTIAVDDGIAMGHGGMLYSLPSRELIADSVEYMVQAHQADALVCISNCDKITPGMLIAAMRLNIPTVFVSGGPMEAGKAVVTGGVARTGLDLIDAMTASADPSVSDDDLASIERSACPTCGSCSGMFTANSMNCLTEALGLSLPGNGSTLATSAARRDLFVRAGELIVDLCRRWYDKDDEAVLPHRVASRAAFSNAMRLDIAMGGSTNTVLHLLAAAREAGVDFDLAAIDELSRVTPCICKVAPSSRLPHGGRAPGGRHPGHPRRAGPGRAARPQRARRARGQPGAVAGRVGRARRHGQPAGHRAVLGRARRRPHHRGVLVDGHLGQPGHRRRRGLHPRHVRARTAPTAAWPCCAATWPPTARWSRRPAWPRTG